MRSKNEQELAKWKGLRVEWGASNKVYVLEENLGMKESQVLEII